MIVLRQFKQNFNAGLYTFSSIRVTGFFASGRNLPFSIKEIKTGVKVIAKNASTNKMKVFVQANGLNNFPSIPVNKKTGRNEVTTMIVEKNTPGPTCLDDRSIITNFSAGESGSFFRVNSFLNENELFFLFIILIFFVSNFCFQLGIVAIFDLLFFFDKRKNNHSCTFSFLFSFLTSPSVPLQKRGRPGNCAYFSFCTNNSTFKFSSSLIHTTHLQIGIFTF